MKLLVSLAVRCEKFGVSFDGIKDYGPAQVSGRLRYFSSAFPGEHKELAFPRNAPGVSMRIAHPLEWLTGRW